VCQLPDPKTQFNKILSREFKVLMQSLSKALLSSSVFAKIQAFCDCMFVWLPLPQVGFNGVMCVLCQQDNSELSHKYLVHVQAMNLPKVSYSTTTKVEAVQPRRVTNRNIKSTS
jgi:hypothetical protein